MKLRSRSSLIVCQEQLIQRTATLIFGLVLLLVHAPYLKASVLDVSASSVLLAPTKIPSFKAVQARYTQSHQQFYDRHGRLLERLREDFTQRRGPWVEVEQVSPALIKAVLLSEDQHFFEHQGVDWAAIAAAAWGRAIRGHARGASTLTMQLVGMLDSALPAAGRRGLTDKFVQLQYALLLERHWTKQQILEAYLNLAPFRGEVVGVSGLARSLFDKDASGLDARESALAAALLRAPNASLELWAQRACRLLSDAGRAPLCDGLQGFIQTRLASHTSEMAPRLGSAPHAARLAQQAHTVDGGLSGALVQTTLDKDLQQFAIASVQRHLAQLAQAQVRDAALVVLDNDSGEVLAYVGSSGALSSAPHVDHALALRQPGSALKPFLYALALQQQRLTAASLLANDRLDIATGNGLYVPQNYDRQYSAWVSVRTALAASLNVPAVRTLMLVGLTDFASLLRALGLPLREAADFYGYSLALGSADVDLLSLTNAYRSLANRGCYSAVRFIASSSKDQIVPQALGKTSMCQTRVLDWDAAWIIGDILADRQARAPTFGVDSPLSTPVWSAVKTGTSKDMRDNWALGWTQHYTVGVWVGNSGGASMREVSGVSGAGPIWQDLIHYLHRARPSHRPMPPPAIETRRIVFQDDIEPKRTEAFVKGTAFERVYLAQDTAGQRGRILSPTDGTWLAMDPDIAAKHQRLLLEASASSGQESWIWRVNGRVVGRGHELWWTPRPGRYQIELLASDGVRQDLVSVRIGGLGRRMMIAP